MVDDFAKRVEAKLHTVFGAIGQCFLIVTLILHNGEEGKIFSSV